MILDSILNIVDDVRDSDLFYWASKPVVSLAMVTFTGVIGVGALTATSASAQATKVANTNITHTVAVSNSSTSPVKNSSSTTNNSSVYPTTKRVGSSSSAHTDKNMLSPAEVIKNFLEILGKNPSNSSSNNNSSSNTGGTPLSSTAPVAIDTLGFPSDLRTVTSPYGPRISPTMGTVDFHTGTDFSGPGACSMPAYASEDGEVVSAGWTSNGYGNRIIIKHNDKVSTTYNHLSEIKVKVGDKVHKGDTVGAIGTTGNSTGCHLHFEVLLDGHIYTDPMPYLVKGTKPNAPDYDINYPAFVGGDPSNPSHADNGDPVNNSTPATSTTPTTENKSSSVNTPSGSPVPSTENNTPSNSPSGNNSNTPSSSPSGTTPVPTSSSSGSQPTTQPSNSAPTPTTPVETTPTTKASSAPTPVETTTPTPVETTKPSEIPTPIATGTNAASTASATI